MIRPFFILLAFLGGMISTSVVAQTQIAFRSGEHEDYSRLAARIPLPEDVVWAQEGRRLILGFTRAGYAFDTAAVFNRIPRIRVQDVRVDNGSAVLTLGCACDVSIFVLAGRTLVIDIADPGAGSRPPARSTPLRRVALSQFVLSQPDPDTTPQTDTSPVSQAVSEAQEALFKQLTRAVDQGLVVLDPEPEQQQQEEAVDLTELITALSEVPGLRARTALDDSAEIIAEEIPQEDDPVCPEPLGLDPREWESGGMFLAQLIEKRQALLGEFDRADEGAALSLSKLYLAFGLGDEALNVLREFRPPEGAPSALLEIAEHHATGRKAAYPVLTGYSGCQNWGGIWALAAGIVPARAPDPETMKIRLSDLRPAARMQIIADIVDTLIAGGYFEVAENLHALAERAGETPSFDHIFNEARLSEARGELPRARLLLSELERAPSEIADRALLEILLFNRRHGFPVVQNDLTDLEAMALVYRGTSFGQEIIEALVLLSVENGDLGRALSLISAAVNVHLASARERGTAALLPPDFETILVAALERADLDRESPSRYVAAIAATIEYLPDRPALDPLRLQIAWNLMDIGLPNLASVVLGPAVQRSNAEARLLQGRLEVARGDPEAALAAVEGLEEDAAEDIRALARVRMPFEPGAPEETIANIPAEPADASPQQLPVTSDAFTDTAVSLQATRDLIARSQAQREALEERLRP